MATEWWRYDLSRCPWKVTPEMIVDACDQLRACGATDDEVEMLRLDLTFAASPDE